MSSYAIRGGDGGDATPLALARELAQRGEIYLAIEILSEALRQQPEMPDPDVHYVQWNAFAELLNKLAVQRAAERAYDIATFLDRMGIDSEHDDGDNQIEEKRPVPVGDASLKSPPARRDTDILSSWQSLPESLPSSSSSSSSEASCEDQVLEEPIRVTKRQRLRRKKLVWKASAAKLFRKLFRRGITNVLQATGIQDDCHASRRRSRRSSIASTQDCHTEDHLRVHSRRFFPSTNEQSTSASRSLGIWALSEYELRGAAEVSAVSTTSVAMMEDKLADSPPDGSVTPRTPHGRFDRFFRSFGFRSSRTINEESSPLRSERTVAV